MIHRVGFASSFSSVDASADPAALVTYLDGTARGLAAMKRYIAVAAARASASGRILDLGCGAGHDLALLEGEGLLAVGIDPSSTMLTTTRARLGPRARLAAATGERLPFASRAFDGCRMERVLQHVPSPAAVLDEAARVVRPGGFLAVFEPDWTGFGFEGSHPDNDAVAAALPNALHPAIGRDLVDLVVRSGFQVVDRVEELSFGYRLADLPMRIEPALERAVGQGRLTPEQAARWLAAQSKSESTGEFGARWSKVLVVASRR